MPHDCSTTTLPTVGVPSGVADQPMGDDETVRGARNRARQARVAHPEADFWCGIEGGCLLDGVGLACFAWVAVEGRNATVARYWEGRDDSSGVNLGDISSRIGMGRSSMFYLPPAVADLVAQGIELGTASDSLWETEDSKTRGGSIGLLTAGALTRAGFCTQAVLCALVPFINPQWYPV